MKKKVFLLLVVAMLALPSLAVAGTTFKSESSSFSTKGWGLSISTGTEVDAFTATLLLTDLWGNVLTPQAALVCVENGSQVFGQVIASAETKQKRFEVFWTTAAILNKLTWHKAEFDPTFGWRFVLGPEDLAQPLNSGRPLMVAVKEIDGKHRFIRVGFKGSIASNAWQNTHVLIKYIDPAVNGESGVSGNQQRIVDYVNRLEERVTSLEGWATAASAARTNGSFVLNSANGAKINFPIHFLGRDCSSLNMTILCADGRGTEYVDYPVTSAECNIALPAGEGYRLSLKAVSDGKEFQSETVIVFWVRPGMPGMNIRL